MTLRSHLVDVYLKIYLFSLKYLKQKVKCHIIQFSNYLCAFIFQIFCVSFSIQSVNIEVKLLLDFMWVKRIYAYNNILNEFLSLIKIQKNFCCLGFWAHLEVLRGSLLVLCKEDHMSYWGLNLCHCHIQVMYLIHLSNPDQKKFYHMLFLFISLFVYLFILEGTSPK